MQAGVWINCLYGIIASIDISSKVGCILRYLTYGLPLIVLFIFVFGLYDKFIA